MSRPRRTEARISDMRRQGMSEAAIYRHLGYPPDSAAVLVCGSCSPREWEPRDYLPNEIAMLRVVRCVAQTTGIDEARILGRALDRKKSVWARQLAMLIIRETIDGVFLREIGEFLDERDHSTVVHGIARAQSRAKSDRRFARMKRTVCRELSSTPELAPGGV